MLEVEIPGRGVLRLAHLVLDVNGTVALDGALLPGVADRLRALGRGLEIHLLTADTHGRQDEVDRALGLQATRLATDRSQAEQKAEHVRRLGAEGAAVSAVREADVVVADVLAALDLLLNPRRLVATLRE